MSREFMFVMLFIVAFAFFGKKTKAQYLNDSTSRSVVNRARYAVITTSSVRRARISEVEGGTLHTLAPQVRTHWVGSYVADNSPKTFWASKSKPPQYVEFKLGNQLMKTVPISRLEMIWGKDYPKRYSIYISEDRENWIKIQNVILEKNKQDIREFSPPLQANYLKLLLEESATKRGFSLVELKIFGPEKEKAPSAPIELKATALGNDRIQLKWDYPSAHLKPYLFKIYRAKEKNFPADRKHLIAEVDELQFEDRGLLPATTYYYKVIAEGFSGTISAPSKEIRETTSPEPIFLRMPVRGVVEGFYNQPWPHQERINIIRFLAQNHFNYYVYAPKNDPYHRQLWRLSYTEEEKENFKELVDTAEASGITFNYGISPGMDFNYKEEEDIRRLKEKLKEMFDLGIRAFTICLDDIPESNKADLKMAQDQVRMVNEVYQYLKSLDEKTELLFVPTVYSRPYSYWLEKKPDFARYLEELAKIEQDVMIMWTGPSNVFSERIDLASSMEYKKLWNHKIVIWDNYPVNDVGLQHHIFLGPYDGREAELGLAITGILSNPMFFPRASLISLFTMGKYFTEPDYCPQRAYELSLREFGDEKGYIALKELADNLNAHPMFPNRSVSILEINQKLNEFLNAYDRGSYEKEEKELKEIFSRYRSNPEELKRGLKDERLYLELEPFSRKLALYGEAGLVALDYLKAQTKEERTRMKKELREILGRAKKNPFRVADTQMGVLQKAYQLVVGGSGEYRAIFEDFIDKCTKKRRN